MTIIYFAAHCGLVYKTRYKERGQEGGVSSGQWQLLPLRLHHNNTTGVCRCKATRTKPGDQQCKNYKGEILPGTVWKTLPQQLRRKVAELQVENSRAANGRP